MTPEDEEFERIAQRQLAALKKATKATTEDAAVRAVHKVMAEYPDNFIDALKYDVAKRDSEFFTHSVEQPYDWSEWVCPDPKGYLMKCCDCGLVHEAEFGVVRYKSETEREDCDMVDDPNLQAVFRMRRSEQWSPADTAHRAGGLPMAEQPAQQPERCQCPECQITLHASDCAVHNEPAYQKGSCDCGAQQWNAVVPSLYPEPEPGVSIKATYEQPAQQEPKIGETNVELGFYSNDASNGQQRELVSEVEMGQLVGNRPHESASNPDAKRAVAVITGVDEYGPMLGWYEHWINYPVGTKLYTSPPASKPLTDDTRRLDALAENSWDLRCFDMPTGAGDADIGWRVIEHHMAKPHERTVGEVYQDDPRKAIDRAIEAAHGIKGDASKPGTATNASTPPCERCQSLC